MKVILFILSFNLILCGCESASKKTVKEEFSVNRAIDSLFYLSKNWTERKPPFEESLIKNIGRHLENVRARNIGNDIDPEAVIFTAKSDTLLKDFTNSSFLKSMEKHEFKKYTVWRSEIDGKKMLEFSLQPHPTEEWIFSIRKRAQE